MKLLKTISLSVLLSATLTANAMKDYVINFPFPFIPLPAFQQISGTQQVQEHKGYTIDCSIASGNGSPEVLKYRVESANFRPQQTDTPDGTYLLYSNQLHHFYKNYSQPIDPSQPSTLRITNLTNVIPGMILVKCENIPPVGKE